MKRILFIGTIAVALAACGAKRIDQANLDLVENYIKAVETMDYETMESLLSDDYLGIGPSHQDTIGKVNALRNWKDNIENLYEKVDYKRSRNFALTVLDGENRGRWISNWSELDITYQDDRGTVTLYTNTIYRIVDGKIVESVAFYNEADALRQLGYVFVNPEMLAN